MRNDNCEQRIDAHLQSRLDDLRQLWTACCTGDEDAGDLGTLCEYGLCFDYVAAGTFPDQREAYFRYQLSWGGPSDEFRFFANPDLSSHRAEYWFLDWFEVLRHRHRACRAGLRRRRRAVTRPITQAEKLWAFRRATNGFANAGNRWAEHARTGLCDAQLEDALRYELGIMGGSGGPGQPSLAFQGAGLKIWASWDGINMVQDKPLVAGSKTIAMARELYGIRDPSNRQTSLF